MSDRFPAFEESSFEWETLKSKNGASYKVGRPKGTDGVQGGIIKADAAEKKNFGIGVNWPVEGSWKKASDEVRETAAITDYKVWQCNSLIGKYCLQFINELHYDYYFFDETGDSYEVNTFRNGQHSVQYDSEKPTINYIKGD